MALGSLLMTCSLNLKIWHPTDPIKYTFPYIWAECRVMVVGLLKILLLFHPSSLVELCQMYTSFPLNLENFPMHLIGVYKLPYHEMSKFIITGRCSKLVCVISIFPAIFPQSEVYKADLLNQIVLCIYTCTYNPKTNGKGS